MKAKVQHDKFSKALNYVSRAVSTKPNIPVLSNILIEGKQDKLQLSATNLDMGITMWIGGTVDTKGKVTASGKFVTDFINASGGEKVDITVENEVMVLKSGKSNADFSTINASEFPILPKPEGEPLFSMSTDEFIDSMDEVLFACSTDLSTSKVQFTGALFELDKDVVNKITFVGLNGYRLSKKTAKIEREEKESHELIVPAKSLQELVKILSSEETDTIEVYLSKSKSQVIFTFGEVEFSVRLLEGPYPDYKPVIPSESSYSFEIEKTDFERAMKVVNTFARNISGNRVDMDLDMETSILKMHTTVPGLGTNETELEVQKANGSSDLKDAYSLQFLMDMVNRMPGTTIKFETDAPLAPAVFRDDSDRNFLHIIMPMQRED